MSLDNTPNSFNMLRMSSEFTEETSGNFGCRLRFHQKEHRRTYFRGGSLDRPIYPYLWVFADQGSHGKRSWTSRDQCYGKGLC